jgi:hypothetical protein
MAAVPEQLAVSASSPRPGLAESLGRVIDDTRALAGEYALLAVLDARRAAVRFAWALSSGIIAALLIATAWIAGVVSGIVYLLGDDASWRAALALAAAANLVAAVVLVLWIRKLLKELPFAALLRQLRGDEKESSAHEDR